jgi:hypothetical protein
MKTLLQQIMTRLGVTEDVAKLILATIPDTLAAPQEVVVDDVVTAAHTKLRSNPSFTEPIEQAANGKMFTILETKMKKAFGLTDEQVAALPEKKRTDAMLELATATLAAKKDDKSADDKDKEITRLNELAAKLKADLKKVREEELPAALATGEATRDELLLERFVEKTLPGKEGLAVELAFAVPGTLAQLRAAYDVKMVAGVPKLYVKGKDIEATDEAHNAVTAEKAVEAIALSGKLRKVNGGRADDVEGEKKKEEGRGSRADADRPVKGLDKAAKHLEELKKRKAEAAKA